MALRDLLHGRGVEDIPNDVYLVMFATVFHWQEQDIVKMDRKRFFELAPMVEMIFRQITQKGL